MSQELRVRLAAGGVLALVFVAGTAIGFALDRERVPAPVLEAEVRDFDRGRPADPPNEWIIDRLDLAAEQRVRIDSVVEHFGAHMSELQKAYRPRYRAVVDSTNHALRQLLTPKQRAQYDSLKALADSRRDHDRRRDTHR